jgi:phosphopantothenoylcysteine decarboxylase/phosphopantothenate--cysteine ligase
MEPEHILTQVSEFFSRTKDFQKKNVLITMGPTQEALDPVRFISNHSSGKMGLAIAEAFRKRGANVFVISGPIALDVTKDKFHWRDVRSANEMYEAAKSIHSQMHIAVFVAAVADYSPVKVSPEKIKKTESELDLKLVKNIDIAGLLGLEKKEDQLHVGFALETENETKNAQLKLKKKNFDLIVLNSTKEKGAGFQLDTNNVQVFNSFGMSVKSGVAPKNEIAHFILDQIKLVSI